MVLLVSVGRALSAADARAWADDFTAGDYHAAWSAAAAAVVADPSAGAWWAYRAASAEALGSHREAIDGFARAEALIGAAFLDRHLLWSRAHALVHERLYARAASELAELSRRWPHSRLAAEDQDLALRIAHRLASGVGTDALNWYRHEAVAAHLAGAPGLAMEFAGEWLLLAPRVEGVAAADDQAVRVELAAAALECGDASRALASLGPVPPDHAGFRASLLRALALNRAGRYEDALAAARAASAGGEATVRRRADRLISDIVHRDGNPP